jgi:hypothetical protein
MVDTKGGVRVLKKKEHILQVSKLESAPLNGHLRMGGATNVGRNGSVEMYVTSDGIIDKVGVSTMDDDPLFHCARVILSFSQHIR